MLKLSYLDALEYSTMWLWRLETAQKEKNQQRQRQTKNNRRIIEINAMDEPKHNDIKRMEQDDDDERE